MSGVRLEGLGKQFGSHWAAVDVNLDIADGEFVVLVGPSGCGKTTTLRMIAGLEESTAGRILIGGRDVTHVHAKDRNIAMVFQSYALYPHMSVRENISFALKIAKLDPAEIDKRIGEVAAILGLSELLDRRPGTLSGGQRQRVALGRAIVRRPEVFLFDEPLSNLDAKLRTSTRSELIKLRRRLGATVIYVTHDQVEAMTMGDRVVVMNEGRVQQIGAPVEVYDDPDNQFVASFIGSPAMNFLSPVLTPTPSALIAKIGAASLALPSGHAAAAGDVIIGIRPEHFVLGAQPGQVTIEARIDTVELLGDEVVLNLDVGGNSLIARLDRGPALKVDESVTLSVAADRVLVFDRASGRRIRGRA